MDNGTLFYVKIFSTDSRISKWNITTQLKEMVEYSIPVHLCKVALRHLHGKEIFVIRGPDLLFEFIGGRIRFGDGEGLEFTTPSLTVPCIDYEVRIATLSTKYLQRMFLQFKDIGTSLVSFQLKNQTLTIQNHKPLPQLSLRLECPNVGKEYNMYFTTHFDWLMRLLPALQQEPFCTFCFHSSYPLTIEFPCGTFVVAPSCIEKK
jgi:hypothetical protein